MFEINDQRYSDIKKWMKIKENKRGLLCPFKLSNYIGFNICSLCIDLFNDIVIEYKKIICPCFLYLEEEVFEKVSKLMEYNKKLRAERKRNNV